MTDVVAEVKDTIVVEKEVEKTKIVELETKEAEVVENGDAKEVVEKSENGDSEAKDKSTENGSAKEKAPNGVSKPDEESTDTKEPDVCGIKRKSEVGLESDDAVDSSEKKQKVEDSVDTEVAPNGIC